MIQKEIEQLSTDQRDLRKFGLMVGGVLLVLGLWTLYRHKPAGPYLATPGALLVLLGLVAPRSLKGIYVAWMALAFSLGLIVSTVLLTVFYFLVITPIGLIARLCGKDFLTRKKDANATSYWVTRKEPSATTPAVYEQQF